MSLDLLSSIVAVLDDLPQHSLWVLEQVFLFNVIKRIRLLQLYGLCVFGNLGLMISTTIAVLMVYPPMSSAASRNLSY